MKKFFAFALAFLFCASEIFCDDEIKFNPWELVIYRSENSSAINEIRAFLKATDENGNDVTDSLSATYEWVSIPDVANRYEKSLYLSGGMAMHLSLKKGKYRFSFFTPKEELVYANVKNKTEWKSNEFFYDTENPAKVIFLFPSADENGFYDGGWILDYKAPKYFKFTKPKMKR